MRFHEELNPKLWIGLELKTDVKEKLNEIAEAFKDYLDIPEDAILDIRITGSSASYNYTEYSDLDLHLIIDYEKVHEDCPLVEGYLWSYKSQFNANHDISIYGVPVELYAEDSRQEAISNGVYSLMEDRWLKEPKKIPPTDNDEDVQAKYQELKDAIEKCDDSEVANELLDKIYTMRKSGLAEVGEFSTENMAFKLLRNDGSIDKLKKLKKEKVDKQLSLECYNEEMYIDEKDVPPLHDYAIIFKYQEPWPDGKLAYRAIMKLTTGSSYRMQSWSYTKEGMINIVKKQWPYADIVDKTNELVSESYNKENVEKLETLEDLKNYFDTGLETIDCEITYFPNEPTQKILRITSASPKINREWLKEVSNGKIKLVGVKQHKNRFGGWIKMYDRFYGYIDNMNESQEANYFDDARYESYNNVQKFNVNDKVRKGKRMATIKKVDSPEKGYLDVEFEDGKNNGSYPSQYFRKITEALNTNKLKEDYEDDYEDIPEEMHKERYVTYFETQEGRQKYTIYHVYTDSTDDSYNELCDKRDNQLGMYNSYKELKDALKERAEKMAAKQGWTVKSIENLGEDDEYYRERNKLESMNNSKNESIKEGFNKGDKVQLKRKIRKITESKDMTETLKSLKEYFAIVDVESGDIVDDGDDAVFDTKEEAEQSMFDRIKFGVPAEWMEVKEFNVDGDLLESLKQTLKEAQDEEVPFIVGDTVVLRGSQPLRLKRKGKVTKIISNDVVEVEFSEVPEQDLMARTDRYYVNELDKFTESLKDIQKPDLSQFKFTDYPNEDGQTYKNRETYRKALQSVLDEIDRRLNKCKYDYSGDTSPIKQAQFIVNDIWRNESVRDSLNLNSSTVKRQPGLYNAIKAVKDYQQQLINELKPLTIWNGKEWVEENKSKNESEEDIMFGVEMFLDTVEGDPEPGLVEFTKTGLIEFLNDYGYDLPMDAANDEVQECAEDFGMVVKYIK